MRGHNKCFYEKLTKIIFELSSNIYLIWTFVYGNIQIFYKINLNIKFYRRFMVSLDMGKACLNVFFLKIEVIFKILLKH